MGAGPGGYVAAIRAAQQGMKVALVEKREGLGGTCLNIGCIPSKALLDSSERYAALQTGIEDHGIIVPDVSINLQKMMERKERVVGQLTSGIATLMKKHKIAVFTGVGFVENPGALRVDGAEGLTQIATDSIILATGSEPVELPFLPFDGKKIVSSTEALSFGEIPESLLVVGAGAIGLELGSVWARLGSSVTVVELMDTVLPGWDLQIARTLKRLLEAQGLTLRLKSKVTGVSESQTGLSVEVEAPDGSREAINADKILVAVGRRPYYSQDIASLGLSTEDSRIVVDSRFRTNVDGIYAIGDIVEGPMLAHKAEEDAIACVEGIAGKPRGMSYDTIPGVVYTWPEAATVGKTEEELKKYKTPYKKGSFPFRANGRALAAGDSDGFVKILAHAQTDRILGAHIVGPQASALIAEIVAVMEFAGSSEDIGRTVHAHPTLPESVREAALAVDGLAIHGG